MRLRLAHRWEKLRTSFWFIPSLLAVAGVLLAFAAVAIDTIVPAAKGTTWARIVGQDPERTAQFLSMLAGSMITVTGVVFSITIVTLSLASGQFGPRLLRNFMRDRGNQVVLGTFIATFLYAAVALLQLGHTAQVTDVPRALVGLAIVLTATSIAVLIYFIHHISVAIQADWVVSSVGRELLDGLASVYPGGCGEEGSAAGVAEELPAWDKPAAPIPAEKEGYLQSVEVVDLIATAEEHDCVIRVLFRPGEYVVAGEALVDVWPAERVDVAFMRQVRRHFALGIRRTPEQDPEFAFDQLVEVAVRALSPGINDPFTAVSCLDRIASGLAFMGARAAPSPYRLANGRLRVITKRSSFVAIVAVALDPIRQNGAKIPAVAVRLLETIARAGAQITDPERRRVLREHADRVMRDVRACGHDAADLLLVERVHAETLAALLDGSGPDGGDGARAGGGVYAELARSVR